MAVAGFALIGLAVLSSFWACVEYARSSWSGNSCVMGASLVFRFFWILGAVFLSLGLLTLSVIGPIGVFAVGSGVLVLGKLFEWFAIDPLLAKIFPTYRRESADTEKF